MHIIVEGSFVYTDIMEGEETHILARPVDNSNMCPSLRVPYSAAFPLATKQKTGLQ